MATARPIAVKTCLKCGETKPVIDFYTTKHKNPDGSIRTMEVRTYCKTCDNARRKQYASRATKPQAVSADDRSTQTATTSSGYHMDTRAVQRLRRIARILARENWRYVGVAQRTDNQQLLAAGMPIGDVQILRKALNHNDDTLLHFIFFEEYNTPGWPAPVEAEQPPEPTEVPNIHEVLAPSASPTSEPFIGYEVEVPTVGTSNASRAPVVAVSEAASNGVLSDLDIEAAAEMIVSTKAHIAELEAVVAEYEDRLRSIREQLAHANNERAAAIAMLRRA